MQTDWNSHYKQKVGSLDFTLQDLERFYTQDKELIDYIQRLKPRRIIEAGSGLGRDALVLASKGISVTLFDQDASLLAASSRNAASLGLETLIDTCEGDLFQFAGAVPKSKYDVVFSCGVLEHFENADICKLLEEQLKVTPVVIFTVPIYSEPNSRYFQDTIFRRLLSPDAWFEILTPFNIKESRITKGRHDDLLVVLER